MKRVRQPSPSLSFSSSSSSSYISPNLVLQRLTETTLIECLQYLTISELVVCLWTSTWFARLLGDSKRSSRLWRNIYGGHHFIMMNMKLSISPVNALSWDPHCRQLSYVPLPPFHQPCVIMKREIIGMIQHQGQLFVCTHHHHIMNQHYTRIWCYSFRDTSPFIPFNDPLLTSTFKIPVNERKNAIVRRTTLYHRSSCWKTTHFPLHDKASHIVCHKMMVIQDALWIIMGYPFATSSVVYRYDPFLHIWTEQPCSFPLYNGAEYLYLESKGVLYIHGGFNNDGKPCSRLVSYDMETGQVCTLSSSNQKYTKHFLIASPLSKQSSQQRIFCFHKWKRSQIEEYLVDKDQWITHNLSLDDSTEVLSAWVDEMEENLFFITSHGFHQLSIKTSKQVRCGVECHLAT